MERELQDEMVGLLAVRHEKHLPDELKGTPIEHLLQEHNFGETRTPPESPSLLIATCMDARVKLRIPPGFAYMLRTAGGNLRNQEFPVSLALASCGIRAVALIAHDDCAMTTLGERRDTFISGFSRVVGCDPEFAGKYFEESAASWGVPDAAGLMRAQAEQLRAKYPEVLVVPLLYRLADHLLYLIEEH